MISSQAASSQSACPGAEMLAAFLRGRLPPNELEGVADHLSACPTCESSVEALHAGDTLLSGLRRPQQPLMPLEEPVCDRLEDRVRRIPAKQSAVEATVSASDTTTDQAGPPLPAVFGSYLLLEQLGQGGMGIVYKARQEALKRLVALKMVRAGVYANAEERMRFQREGEAIARLHHPHVVQIHEFGEHVGQLYFSMELMEGGTLASKLNGQPLPEQEAAEMVRTLARTVAAAHRQGVVHRDLKPGNILLAADGTVKIADFGLAKVLDAEGSETCSDAILGTPAYMAPEQARGESRRIGPAVDVYALGAVLYETLVGRPPFKAESRFQTLELVRTREPEPPSRRRPGLSRELEAICLKCLEKEPSQRYASAEALADDLERWLKGEPVSIRPPSRAGRLIRRLLRRPLLRAALGLLVVSAFVVSATLHWSDPERPLKNLERRLSRGETVTVIGASGPPLWFQWSLRPGIVVPDAAEDAFTLSALDPALLMLLRDPQGSYRFSAEVQQTDMSRSADVGLYFAYSRHHTNRGEQHCFCTLTFNDWLPRLDPQTQTRRSRVEWNMWRSQKEYVSSRILSQKDFIPATQALPGVFPWRSLAVEVRLDGFEVFWEGQSFAFLPCENMGNEFRLLNRIRDGDRMVGFSPDLHPAFSPHDSLGLYVGRGTAGYRHVVVQPLP